MKYHVLALIVASTLGAPSSALDLDSVLKGGQSALKAASLSDADVKDLTDKACVEMDSKSRVAQTGDKYAARLKSVMKDMPGSVKGQPINYKVYLTTNVNAWAMANGCVRA